jgi:hypothetical protein
MSFDDTIKNRTSRAGVVRVRNALNPLLWALAVITPLAFFAAYFFRDDVVLKYGLIAFGMLPFLSMMIAYFVLLFGDRDRLQSEEFVLRQQELMFYRKGEGGRVVPRSDEAPRIEKHRLSKPDGEAL